MFGKTDLALPRLLDRREADVVGSFPVVADVAGQPLRLPAEVRTRDGFLEWTEWGLEHWQRPRTGGASARVPAGVADPGCLERFLGLADPSAADDRIARFARRYGVLYLDPDGRPGGEPPTLAGAPVVLDQLSVRTKDGRYERLQFAKQWYREPLEAWRAWARHARLMLTFGLELRGGERISPRPFLGVRGIELPADTGDWGVPDVPAYIVRDEGGTPRLTELGHLLFWELSPHQLFSDLEGCRTAAAQRSCLGAHLDRYWVRPAGFGVAVTWDGERPRITMVNGSQAGRAVSVVHNCFPTLAGQLVGTLSGDRRTNRCADCGEPYPCERRRSVGKCPDCRAAARRASKRASKRRRASTGPAGERPQS